jgi:predicted O-methyltransferase YrrM
MASIAKAQQRLDQLSELIDLAVLSGYARYDSLLLLAELVREFQPRRVLELGVLHGCSTIFMAKALSAGSEIVAVDDFTLSTVADVQASLKRHGVDDRVTLLQSDTRDLAGKLEGTFDFVFLDASHVSADVLAEFQAINASLIRPPVLVFDDALCIPEALAEIGINHHAMRAYEVNHGLCVIVSA